MADETDTPDTPEEPDTSTADLPAAPDELGGVWPQAWLDDPEMLQAIQGDYAGGWAAPPPAPDELGGVWPDAWLNDPEMAAAIMGGYAGGWLPADASGGDAAAWNPGSFDPKNNDQWATWRNTAAQGTKGINNMPFVFGGSNTPGYASLAGMSAPDIKAAFYSPRGAAAAAASGGDPNAFINSLLGGIGFGGLGTSGPALQLAAQAAAPSPTITPGFGGLGIAGGSQFSPTMTPTAQPISGSAPVSGTFGGLGYRGV